MPALPDAPGAVRWEAHYALGDDLNLVNVMHLDTGIPGGLTLLQIQALGNAAGAAWDAQLFAGLSNQAQMTHHVFTDLSTPTGPQYVLSDLTVGGVVSPAAPASSCMLIKQTTATRGRSYRGRIYLSGVAKADIVNPTDWDAGTVETFEDAFEAIQVATEAASTPASFCIVSYFGPPTVKAGSISPGVPKRSHSTLRGTAIVTGPCVFTGEFAIASQRRRNGAGR